MQKKFPPQNKSGQLPSDPAAAKADLIRLERSLESTRPPSFGQRAPFADRLESFTSSVKPKTRRITSSL